MDDQLQSYRSRWQAVAAVEAVEAKAASVAEKWKQTNAIFRLAIGMNLLVEQDDSERGVYLRWAKLKERIS